jgi:sulfite exporter TauE/SafE
MTAASRALLEMLAVAAATVGSLHSLAPDHWVPFAAVARARGWSGGRTARVTLACGFGHVTVSVLLGVLGLVLGREVLEAFAGKLEAAAGVLLIAFGLTYAAWGARRAAAKRFHGHTHDRYDHVHDTSRLTAWGLFLFFSADPCVAVIPLFLAAAPLGWTGMASVALVYEAATIGTMTLLVLPARAGARVLRLSWLDRYGDAAAGGLIAAVGVLVIGFGW